MAKNIIKEIRSATCRKFSSEEKIRIVLEGFRGRIKLQAIRRLAILCDSPT